MGFDSVDSAQVPVAQILNLESLFKSFMIVLSVLRACVDVFSAVGSQRISIDNFDSFVPVISRLFCSVVHGYDCVCDRLSSSLSHLQFYEGFDSSLVRIDNDVL